MAVYGDPPPCPVCMKWHFPQCAEPCGTCKPLADRVATLETALRMARDELESVRNVGGWHRMHSNNNEQDAEDCVLCAINNALTNQPPPQEGTVNCDA